MHCSRIYIRTRINTHVQYYTCVHTHDTNAHVHQNPKVTKPIIFQDLTVYTCKCHG